MKSIEAKGGCISLSDIGSLNKFQFSKYRIRMYMKMQRIKTIFDFLFKKLIYNLANASENFHKILLLHKISEKVFCSVNNKYLKA
jgi:hypothetical protein